jgi:two-component system, sensor histidine kinase and response regulator
MQHTILVVDDEKDIVDSIERQFRKKYKLLKTTSGMEALRIMQTETIHLILSDQRMPEMTGVQLFERAQKIQPDAIRILLTGYSDVESVIAAINNGQIYRYITKPWDPTDLDVIVRRALDAYDLKTELKEKNIKLEEALKELKTLDQAKSQFMILIGHELKTPLTTMSSFLDLLKEEKLTGDVEKYVNRISQGSDRLKEIIFDVLDVMSAETGQMKLKRENQSLLAVVEQVLEEFESLIEKKELKVSKPEKSLKAQFDSNIILKVLRKIIHNGIKFGSEGSTLKISISENSGNAEVAITNSGPGLSKTKIEHILKPFNIDEDIMNHSQGLGLGLSVTQSLLKRHGSALLLESDSKKTTVGFSIPLKSDGK